MQLPASIQSEIRNSKQLLLLGTILVLISWYFALAVIGAEKDQGEIYRIMFVHVPVAWCSFMWVGLSAIFAVFGLAKPLHMMNWDRSSKAAIELGTVFAFLTLATGMIWGKPTWGVWWDWDPRLTSTLVMLLVCLGYHILRSFTPDLRARRLVSAIIAILAAINVPIVYYSVNIWRSLHQPQTFVRKSSNASADIGYVLLGASIALVLLSVAIYKIRRQSIAAQEMLQEARNA